MSSVELNWANKGKRLNASGNDGYCWSDAEPDAHSPSQPIVVAGSPPRVDSNLLVIGDGQDALESISTHSDFLSRGVRLVYIDPPFNTQSNFNHYKDTMSRSTWLSMLRDRLVAVRPFLSDDASIWVHLDDAEVHRARCVMDEVFGETAFVASVIWQKKTTRDSRAAFSSNHDTILVYAPSGPKKWKTSRNLLSKDEAHLTNRDSDPRGPWTDAPFTAPGYRKAQQYEIRTPSGRILLPPRGRSWYATEATFRELLVDDRIWFPKGGDGSPRLKLFAHQLRGLVPFTVWGAADTGTNDDAKRHLMALFPDVDVFDTPKPESLIERIIHIATNPGELVVDLFGGSGTTSAAAHKTHRRWLVIERNAQTVVHFLLPRMIRVILGTDPGGITSDVAWRGGGGFTVAQVEPRFGRVSGIHRPAALNREVARIYKRFGLDVTTESRSAA